MIPGGTCEIKDIVLGDMALPLASRTCVMGVLNVTPDSFSDGGSFMDKTTAVARGLMMAKSGADIIDVGGESSRPGAGPVPLEIELERVIPVVKALAGKLDIPVSVDTTKSEVARAALAEGARIVNDITALCGDPGMAAVAAEFDAAVVLMHMKGDPSSMQTDPFYADVTGEICDYLSQAAGSAEEAGIDPGKIIVDPGIGFGKTLEHNLTILRELEKLCSLGKPVLIGTSRKSFLGRITGKKAPERAFSTAASCAIAVMNGASIVRVHDPASMIDAVRVADALKGKLSWDL